jgi:hypothetical protein
MLNAMNADCIQLDNCLNVVTGPRSSTFAPKRPLRHASKGYRIGTERRLSRLCRSVSRLEEQLPQPVGTDPYRGKRRSTRTAPRIRDENEHAFAGEPLVASSPK